jgi:hypothetical protein
LGNPIARQARRPDLLASSFRHFPAGPQLPIAGLPVFAVTGSDHEAVL